MSGTHPAAARGPASSMEDFALEVCRTPADFLRKTLDKYPEGGQILQEKLQNAVDAGATRAGFFLVSAGSHDKETSPNRVDKDSGAREKRFAGKRSLECSQQSQGKEQHGDDFTGNASDEENYKEDEDLSRDIEKLSLLEFCGDALYMTNDSVFTPEDWKSWKRMYESQKAHKPGKIGQYGLGSRSFFHLTDLVTVLSDTTLAIVDPSNLVFPSGGIKFDITTDCQKLLIDLNLADKGSQKQESQEDTKKEGLSRQVDVEINAWTKFLAGFENFGLKRKSDGSNNFEPFAGTVFRLPLRTARQAKLSQVSKRVQTPEEILGLMRKRFEDAASLLRFTHSVRQLDCGVYDGEGNYHEAVSVKLVELPPDCAIAGMPADGKLSGEKNEATLAGPSKSNNGNKNRPLHLPHAISGDEGQLAKYFASSGEHTARQAVPDFLREHRRYQDLQRVLVENHKNFFSSKATALSSSSSVKNTAPADGLAIVKHVAYQILIQTRTNFAVFRKLQRWDNKNKQEQNICADKDTSDPDEHEGRSKTSWIRELVHFAVVADRELCRGATELHTSPVVAVALPLPLPLPRGTSCKREEEQQEQQAHQAYTYLPIPGATGLPFPVHGDFQLHDDRRSIWASETDSDVRGAARLKHEWNTKLAVHTLSRLLAEHAYPDVAALLVRSAYEGVGPLTDPAGHAEQDGNADVSRTSKEVAPHTVSRRDHLLVGERHLRESYYRLWPKVVPHESAKGYWHKLTAQLPKAVSSIPVFPGEMLLSVSAAPLSRPCDLTILASEFRISTNTYSTAVESGNQSAVVGAFPLRSAAMRFLARCFGSTEKFLPTDCPPHVEELLEPECRRQLDFASFYTEYFFPAVAEQLVDQNTGEFIPQLPSRTLMHEHDKEGDITSRKIDTLASSSRATPRTADAASTLAIFTAEDLDFLLQNYLERVAQVDDAALQAWLPQHEFFTSTRILRTSSGKYMRIPDVHDPDEKRLRQLKLLDSEPDAFPASCFKTPTILAALNTRCGGLRKELTWETIEGLAEKIAADGVAADKVALSLAKDYESASELPATIDLGEYEPEHSRKKGTLTASERSLIRIKREQQQDGGPPTADSQQDAQQTMMRPKYRWNQAQTLTATASTSTGRSSSSEAEGPINLISDSDDSDAEQKPAYGNASLLQKAKRLQEYVSRKLQKEKKAMEGKKAGEADGNVVGQQTPLLEAGVTVRKNKNKRKQVLQHQAENQKTELDETKEKEVSGHSRPWRRLFEEIHWVPQLTQDHTHFRIWAAQRTLRPPTHLVARKDVNGVFAAHPVCEWNLQTDDAFSVVAEWSSPPSNGKWADLLLPGSWKTTTGVDWKRQLRSLRSALQQNLLNVEAYTEAFWFLLELMQKSNVADMLSQKDELDFSSSLTPAAEPVASDSDSTLRHLEIIPIGNRLFKPSQCIVSNRKLNPLLYPIGNTLLPFQRELSVFGAVLELDIDRISEVLQQVFDAHAMEAATSSHQAGAIEDKETKNDEASATSFSAILPMKTDENREEAMTQRSLGTKHSEAVANLLKEWAEINEHSTKQLREKNLPKKRNSNFAAEAPTIAQYPKYVLTLAESLQLRENVCFNDGRQGPGVDEHRVLADVFSPADALALGVPRLADIYARPFEREDDEEGAASQGQDLEIRGQQRHLGDKSLPSAQFNLAEDASSFDISTSYSDRVRAILEDYQDPGSGLSTICNENIQNFDDGGAEEVWFVIDERKHPAETLLSKTDKMRSLQGPAFVIAGDSVFSQQDLKSIQRLDRSSKRLQFDKDGQFGVGMNAAYHATDSMMLRTHGDVVFFDPLGEYCCKDLQDGKPGRRFPEQTLRDHWPDQIAPFASLDDTEFPDGFRLPSGTQFRLPFRLKSSNLKRKVFELKDYRAELRSWAKQEMWKCQIFARSLRRIAAAHIAANGEVTILGQHSLQIKPMSPLFLPEKTREGQQQGGRDPPREGTSVPASSSSSSAPSVLGSDLLERSGEHLATLPGPVSDLVVPFLKAEDSEEGSGSRGELYGLGNPRSAGRGLGKMLPEFVSAIRDDNPREFYKQLPRTAEEIEAHLDNSRPIQSRYCYSHVVVRRGTSKKTEIEFVLVLFFNATCLDWSLRLLQEQETALLPVTGIALPLRFRTMQQESHGHVDHYPGTPEFQKRVQEFNRENEYLFRFRPLRRGVRQQSSSVTEFYMHGYWRLHSSRLLIQFDQEEKNCWNTMLMQKVLLPTYVLAFCGALGTLKRVQDVELERARVREAEKRAKRANRANLFSVANSESEGTNTASSNADLARSCLLSLPAVTAYPHLLPTCGTGQNNGSSQTLEFPPVNRSQREGKESNLHTVAGGRKSSATTVEVKRESGADGAAASSCSSSSNSHANASSQPQRFMRDQWGGPLLALDQVFSVDDEEAGTDQHQGGTRVDPWQRFADGCLASLYEREIPCVPVCHDKDEEETTAGQQQRGQTRKNAMSTSWLLDPVALARHAIEEILICEISMDFAPDPVFCKVSPMQMFDRASLHQALAASGNVHPSTRQQVGNNGVCSNVAMRELAEALVPDENTRKRITEGRIGGEDVDIDIATAINWLRQLQKYQSTLPEPTLTSKGRTVPKGTSQLHEGEKILGRNKPLSEVLEFVSRFEKLKDADVELVALENSRQEAYGHVVEWVPLSRAVFDGRAALAFCTTSPGEEGESTASAAMPMASSSSSSARRGGHGIGRYQYFLELRPMIRHVMSVSLLSLRAQARLSKALAGIVATNDRNNSFDRKTSGNIEEKISFAAVLNELTPSRVCAALREYADKTHKIFDLYCPGDFYDPHTKEWSPADDVVNQVRNPEGHVSSTSASFSSTSVPSSSVAAPLLAIPFNCPAPQSVDFVEISRLPKGLRIRKESWVRNFLNFLLSRFWKQLAPHEDTLNELEGTPLLLLHQGLLGRMPNLQNFSADDRGVVELYSRPFRTAASATVHRQLSGCQWARVPQLFLRTPQHSDVLWRNLVNSKDSDGLQFAPRLSAKAFLQHPERELPPSYFYDGELPSQELSGTRNALGHGTTARSPLPFASLSLTKTQWQSLEMTVSAIAQLGHARNTSFLAPGANFPAIVDTTAPHEEIWRASVSRWPLLPTDCGRVLPLSRLDRIIGPVENLPSFLRKSLQENGYYFRGNFAERERSEVLEGLLKAWVPSSLQNFVRLLTQGESSSDFRATLSALSDTQKRDCALYFSGALASVATGNGGQPLSAAMNAELVFLREQLRMFPIFPVLGRTGYGPLVLRASKKHEDTIADAALQQALIDSGYAAPAVSSSSSRPPPTSSSSHTGAARQRNPAVTLSTPLATNLRYITGIDILDQTFVAGRAADFKQNAAVFRDCPMLLFADRNDLTAYVKLWQFVGAEPISWKNFVGTFVVRLCKRAAELGRWTEVEELMDKIKATLEDVPEDEFSRQYRSGIRDIPFLPMPAKRRAALSGAGTENNKKRATSCTKSSKHNKGLDSKREDAKANDEVTRSASGLKKRRLALGGFSSSSAGNDQEDDLLANEEGSQQEPSATKNNIAKGAVINVQTSSASSRSPPGDGAAHIDDAALLVDIPESAAVVDPDARTTVVELFDPEVPLLKTFLDDDDFPQGKYANAGWLKFLRRLGLRSRFHAEDFIAHAEHVAQQAAELTRSAAVEGDSTEAARAGGAPSSSSSICDVEKGKEVVLEAKAKMTTTTSCGGTAAMASNLDVEQDQAPDPVTARSARTMPEFSQRQERLRLRALLLFRFLLSQISEPDDTTTDLSRLQNVIGGSSLADLARQGQFQDKEFLSRVRRITFIPAWHRDVGVKDRRLVWRTCGEVLFQKNKWDQSWTLYDLQAFNISALDMPSHEDAVKERRWILQTAESPQVWRCLTRPRAKGAKQPVDNRDTPLHDVSDLVNHLANLLHYLDARTLDNDDVAYALETRKQALDRLTPDFWSVFRGLSMFCSGGKRSCHTDCGDEQRRVRKLPGGSTSTTVQEDKHAQLEHSLHGAGILGRAWIPVVDLTQPASQLIVGAAEKDESIWDLLPASELFANVEIHDSWGHRQCCSHFEDKRLSIAIHPIFRALLFFPYSTADADVGDSSGALSMKKFRKSFAELKLSDFLKQMQRRFPLGSRLTHENAETPLVDAGRCMPKNESHSVNVKMDREDTAVAGGNAQESLALVDTTGTQERLLGTNENDDGRLHMLTTNEDRLLQDHEDVAGDMERGIVAYMAHIKLLSRLWHAAEKDDKALEGVDPRMMRRYQAYGVDARTAVPAASVSQRLRGPPVTQPRRENPATVQRASDPSEVDEGRDNASWPPQHPWDRSQDPPRRLITRTVKRETRQESRPTDHATKQKKEQTVEEAQAEQEKLLEPLLQQQDEKEANRNKTTAVHLDDGAVSDECLQLVEATMRQELPLPDADGVFCTANELVLPAVASGLAVADAKALGVDAWGHEDRNKREKQKREAFKRLRYVHPDLLPTGSFDPASSTSRVGNFVSNCLQIPPPEKVCKLKLSKVVQCQPGSLDGTEQRACDLAEFLSSKVKFLDPLAKGLTDLMMTEDASLVQPVLGGIRWVACSQLKTAYSFPARRSQKGVSLPLKAAAGLTRATSSSSSTSSSAMVAPTCDVRANDFEFGSDEDETFYQDGGDRVLEELDPDVAGRRILFASSLARKLCDHSSDDALLPRHRAQEALQSVIHKELGISCDTYCSANSHGAGAAASAGASGDAAKKEQTSGAPDEMRRRTHVRRVLLDSILKRVIEENFVIVNGGRPRKARVAGSPKQDRAQVDELGLVENMEEDSDPYIKADDVNIGSLSEEDVEPGGPGAEQQLQPRDGGTNRKRQRDSTSAAEEEEEVNEEGKQAKKRKIMVTNQRRSSAGRSQAAKDAEKQARERGERWCASQAGKDAISAFQGFLQSHFTFPESGGQGPHHPGSSASSSSTAACTGALPQPATSSPSSSRNAQLAGSGSTSPPNAIASSLESELKKLIVTAVVESETKTHAKQAPLVPARAGALPAAENEEKENAKNEETLAKKENVIKGATSSVEEKEAKGPRTSTTAKVEEKTTSQKDEDRSNTKK
ncbi:unnamed protein product [Amoebophrya sp. A25]|nr:unnamed protein product [Amoebophrya sp. A25]|eukprot:GSA25T00005041001.1